MTIFFGDIGVVLLSCTRAVFGASASLRCRVPAWLEQSKSRFMPDYILLSRDACGNLLVPKPGVCTLRLGPPPSTSAGLGAALAWTTSAFRGPLQGRQCLLAESVGGMREGGSLV